MENCYDCVCDFAEKMEINMLAIKLCQLFHFLIVFSTLSVRRVVTNCVVCITGDFLYLLLLGPR
jgi:hypothetical protein